MPRHDALPPPDDGGLRKALRETLTFVGLLPQDSGEHLIKRVIGLPGDLVRLVGGRLWIDDHPVGEPFGHVPLTETTEPWRVPAVWVRGSAR